MVLRVARTAVALVVLATAGWGITIPIASSTGTTFTQSTLYPANTYQAVTNGTYTALANQAVDTNWRFVLPNNSDVSAYVFHNPAAKPMTQVTPPWYSGIGSSSGDSRWISPDRATGNGNLQNGANGTFLAYTEFTLSNPNVSSWTLVFQGQVWASDVLNGIGLYSVAQGSVVRTGSFIGTASPSSAATFNIRWTDLAPGTYQLRFTFQNLDSGLDYAGIRVQFARGMHYATPEPGAWALMLTAGAGLAFASWRRRRAKKPQA
jgi:hypothetical protein